MKIEFFLLLIKHRKTNIKAKVYNLNQWDIVGDGGKRREELTLGGKLQVQTSLK